MSIFSRPVSSRIMLLMLVIALGVLVMELSLNICEANDMDDIGVLNSCVILSMKSFFILLIRV